MLSSNDSPVIGERPHIVEPSFRAAIERRAIFALLAIGALLTLVYSLVLPGSSYQTLVADIVFVTVSGGAGILCWRTARRLGSTGVAWRFFGTGCLFWCTGQVYWNVYELGFGLAPSYPSFADVGYLGLYSCFLAGLFITMRRSFDELPARELLLDSLIVVVVVGAVQFKLLLQPLIQANDMSGFGVIGSGLVVSLLWQSGTAGLIFLTVLALVWRADMLDRRPLLALLGALSLFAAGNLVYGRLALLEGYYSGHPIDLLWIEGFIGVAIAALLATRQSGIVPSFRDPLRMRWAAIIRSVLLATSILTVAGFGVYGSIRPARDPQIAVVLAVSGALIALRIGYAAFQSERLDRRTRERDRLAGVIHAAAAISGVVELDSLMPRLAEVAASTVGRNHAGVFIFSADGTQVETSFFHGFTPAELLTVEECVAWPVGAFDLEERVIRTREPAIQEAVDPGAADEQSTWLRAVGMTHALIAPLLANDRVLGTIVLWSRGDTRSFDSSDIAAAAAIGHHAGMAITNAQLLEKTRRNALEQAALLRVSQVSISNLDVRSVLAEIAQASLGIASAESCSIEIWHPEDDDTEMIAQAYAHGWEGPSNVGARYPLTHWDSSRRVLTERMTLNLVTTDLSLTEQERETFTNAGTRAVLVVPLVIGNASLGVLTLFSRTPKLFSADDVRIGRELAAQVSLAIERARLHEALRSQADTDGLTGLLNHRAILETLDRELIRLRRTGDPVAVMMIDLDGFKQVNDTWGHQAGDDVLRHTASLLRSTVREIDAVGRYGGDEFLIVLPGIDRSGAESVAMRLRERFEATNCSLVSIDVLARVPIDLSIGIAAAPSDAEFRTDLVSLADVRMYALKTVQRR